MQVWSWFVSACPSVMQIKTKRIEVLQYTILNECGFKENYLEFL